MQIAEFRTKVDQLWNAHRATIEKTSSKRAKWLDYVIRQIWDWDDPGMEFIRADLYNQLEKLTNKIVNAVTPSHRAIWHLQPQEDGTDAYQLSSFHGIIFRPLADNQRIPTGDPGWTEKYPHCVPEEEKNIHRENIYRRTFLDELMVYQYTDEDTERPIFKRNINSNTMRIDVELPPIVDKDECDYIIAQLVNKICKKGEWEFLGLKTKSSGSPTAVFLRIPDEITDDKIWAAITNAFGEKICNEVATKCEMKTAQNLTILSCRQGFKAHKDTSINLPGLLQHTGLEANVDGVMLWLDKTATTQLRHAYSSGDLEHSIIPESARMLAGTILWKNVVLSKGTIMLNMPRNVAFDTTVKFGSWAKATHLPTTSILIAEIDALNKSGRVLSDDVDTQHDQREFDKTELFNTNYHDYADDNGKVTMVSYSPSQEIPYNTQNNFQRQRIIDKIILPWIKEQESPNFMLKLKTLEKLVALDIGNVNRGSFLKTFTPRMLESATKPKMPGKFALVAPCRYTIMHELGLEINESLILQRKQIRVPKGSFPLDSEVDVTRFPCLPIGTATQRYMVVGYTNGNYCEVSQEIWTNIQGGDFDGDKARLTRFTVDLFPDLVYPDTSLSLLKDENWNMGTETIKGLESRVARVEQAVKVACQNIGTIDLEARRASEIMVPNPAWEEQSRDLAQDCLKDNELDQLPKLLKQLEQIVPRKISLLDLEFEVPTRSDRDLGLSDTLNIQPWPFEGQKLTLRILYSAAIQATIDSAKKQTRTVWLPTMTDKDLIPKKAYLTDHLRKFKACNGRNIRALKKSFYYPGCRAALDAVKKPLPRGRLNPKLVHAKLKAKKLKFCKDNTLRKEVMNDIWKVVEEILELWQGICKSFEHNPTGRANEMALLDELIKIHFAITTHKARYSPKGNKWLLTPDQKDEITTMLALAFLTKKQGNSKREHLIVRLPVDYTELITTDLITKGANEQSTPTNRPDYL